MLGVLGLLHSAHAYFYVTFNFCLGVGTTLVSDPIFCPITELQFSNLFHLLCPQFRRSCGSILVSGCACIRSSKTVHSRVLKFHIWIPHGKIADTHFFCPSYLPFWRYAPLKKSKRNLMHAISYEPCMLGF